MKKSVKAMFKKSEFASETDTLTTAFLNYIGNLSGYQKDNKTASGDSDSKRRSLDATSDSSSFSRRSFDPQPLSDGNFTLKYGESYLAFSYQQCTELGLFQTSDAPSAANGQLPILSKLQTLHFLKDTYCRIQLGIELNETGINPKWNELGGYLLDYPRIFFSGGEVDPVSSPNSALGRLRA